MDFKNNVSNFKADFKKEFGIDADKNMDMYFKYLQARQMDDLLQTQIHLVKSIDRLSESLPNDMLRTFGPYIRENFLKK